jgi:hypothetical protein
MDLFHPHPAKFEILYMEYISTEDSDKYDITHGRLTESPLRGSTARYICNPIVDDIEASRNLNEEYQLPDCEVIGETHKHLRILRTRTGGKNDVNHYIPLLRAAAASVTDVTRVLSPVSPDTVTDVTLTSA